MQQTKLTPVTIMATTEKYTTVRCLCHCKDTNFLANHNLLFAGVWVNFEGTTNWTPYFLDISAEMINFVGKIRKPMSTTYIWQEKISPM